MTTTRRVSKGCLALSLVFFLLLVAAPLACADSTWTGTGADANWSTTANWQSASGPAAGAADGTLTFPSMTCSSTCSSSNDLSGVALTGLVIDGKTSYDITGSGVTLGSGGITTTGSGANLAASWNAPIALTSPQNWSIGGGGQLALAGGVSGSADSLDADMSADTILAFDSDDEIGAFTAGGAGFVSLGGGASLNGTDGNPVNITSGSYLQQTGNATVGPLTSTGGNLTIGSAFGTDVLTVNGAANLASSGSSEFGVSPSSSSLLSASGNVSLGGSLSLQSCTALSSGTYTLVQTTGGSLTGTFVGVPEGAVLTATCLGSTAEGTLQIHYTSTSVTATVLAPTTTSLSTPSPAASATNQTVTLTANVTASSGTPTGTVEFDAGGQPISGCTAQALTSGSATCQTSFTASSSPETLTATYTPASGAAFEGSSTGSATSLTVSPDATTTVASASATTSFTGQSVTYTATVAPADAGASEPSGPVAFADSGNPISSCAAQPLAAGASSSTATCTITYASIGSHTITATYGGDTNFAGSAASGGLTVDVLAPTPLGFTQNWGSYGAGEGQLEDPDGVAAYGGDIYVADFSNNRVDEFTSSGSFVSSFGSAGSGNGQLTQPQGIAVDPTNGDIYVADAGNRRVEEFDSSGNYLATIGAGTVGYTTQIAVNGNGNVYVASYSPAMVAEFDSSGTYVRSFGTDGGTGPGQLSEPWGVAVNASGDVYVSDYDNDRISEFDPTGSFIAAWGWGVSDGANQFETCTASCEAGVAGDGAGQLDDPANLAIDGSGDVWVIEQQDARIDEFTSSGGFVQAAGWGVADGQSQFETCTAGCQAGLSGTGAGQLSGGYGLGSDGAGDLYVADGNEIDQFALAAPANATAPSISGTAQDGQVLTAAPGVWAPAAGSYDYAWYDCSAASAGTDGTGCNQIPEATSSTYALTPADVGHSIEVSTSGTNGVGSSSPVPSTVTGPVQALVPANAGGEGAPTITGAAQDGQTLTAVPGTWTGSTPITYSYQWVECDGTGSACTPLSGATGTAYTLTGSDVGHELELTVTASNATLSGGGSNSADSAPTSAVGGVAPPAPSMQSAPANPSGSRSASFSFAGVSGATFACSLDGAAPTPCTSPVELSPLSDGQHTFTVAQTSEGLTSTPASYSWTVTTAPPGAPTIVGGPDPESGPGPATIQFETDPGASAECSVDGGEFAACTSPVTLTNLSLGPHTFAVRQTDEAGVTSSAAIRTWRIDLNFEPGPVGANEESVTGLLNPQLAVGASEPIAVGCQLARGSLQQCTVAAYADPAQAGIAAVELIGTGQTAYTVRGHQSAVVEITLNALGRELMKKHPAGLKTTFSITARPFDTSSVSRTTTQSTLLPPELLVVPGAGLFPGGAAKLDTAARRYVKAVVQLIAGATRVRCLGYTDNSLGGARAHRLGLTRARNVCKALVADGLTVPWSAISFGASDPRATNATAAGRAANRRVNIRAWFS